MIYFPRCVPARHRFYFVGSKAPTVDLAVMLAPGFQV